MFAVLVSGAPSQAAPPVVSTASENSPVENAPVETAAAAQTGPIEASFTYKDVPVSDKDSTATRDLRIDWTRPRDWQATDSRGAVVFFHGGGWVGGTPEQFAPHCKALADRGLVCFRVEYRLLPRKSNDPPETCVADVSDAMRTLRGSAAKFGIDPNRIACGGGSAGGHLAAYLGMMDDVQVDGASRKANALLLYNPVYDNGPGQWGAQRVGEQTDRYSPAHNISADDPPAIVFLGENDALIPVSTAERFQRLSHDVGLVSELVTYPGRSHGFFNKKVAKGKYHRDTLEKSIVFLDNLGWMDPK